MFFCLLYIYMFVLTTSSSLTVILIQSDWIRAPWLFPMIIGPDDTSTVGSWLCRLHLPQLPLPVMLSAPSSTLRTAIPTLVLPST